MRFTSITRRQAAGSRSAIVLAAEDSRVRDHDLGGAEASRSRAAPARTASQSVTSATTASACRRAARISSASLASASAWTSQQPTRSPRSANRRAWAAPIPLAAPVTQTVRGSLTGSPGRLDQLDRHAVRVAGVEDPRSLPGAGSRRSLPARRGRRTPASRRRAVDRLDIGHPERDVRRARVVRARADSACRAGARTRSARAPARAASRRSAQRTWASGIPVISNSCALGLAAGAQRRGRAGRSRSRASGRGRRWSRRRGRGRLTRQPVRRPSPTPVAQPRGDQVAREDVVDRSRAGGSARPESPLTSAVPGRGRALKLLAPASW